MISLNPVFSVTCNCFGICSVIYYEIIMAVSFNVLYYISNIGTSNVYCTCIICNMLIDFDVLGNNALTIKKIFEHKQSCSFISFDQNNAVACSRHGLSL